MMGTFKKRDRRAIARALVCATAVAACRPTTPETQLGYVPPSFECTAMNVARWQKAAPSTDVAPRGEPAAAGQMSDAAAHAKRLYDGERFAEAVSALHAVAAGDSKDDEGNRQIAQYYEATSLFRLKRYAESVRLFRGIAAQPSHLKHNETLLWLARLAGEAGSAADLAPRDFASYSRADVLRFDNAQQRPLWSQLSYLVAVAGLAEGGRDEAAGLLRSAASGGAYVEPARVCMAAYGVR